MAVCAGAQSCQQHRVQHADPLRPVPPAQRHVPQPRSQLLPETTPTHRGAASPSLSPPFLFDIFCNHVIYNRSQVDRYFPRDVKHLAILRHPWRQVQSAFHYYTTAFHVSYLKGVPSFQVFVKNQSRFEPSDPLHSKTNNRMSVDLGLPRTPCQRPLLRPDLPG